MLFQLLFSSKSIQNILILWAIVAPFASASIRPVVNRLNQDTTVYYGLIYGLVFCAFSWPYTYYGILTTFPLPSPWRSNFFFTSSTISDSVPSLVLVLQSAHTRTQKIASRSTIRLWSGLNWRKPEYPAFPGGWPGGGVAVRSQPPLSHIWRTTGGVVMAYSLPLSRSTNCARTLFNHGLLRRLLLPRCIIGAEGRTLLQFPGKASLSSWSRHRGQIIRCSRFCSSKAGIVQSKYTVDIPEVSLSEFMIDDFQGYGDDLAMVSWVYANDCLRSLFVLCIINKLERSFVKRENVNEVFVYFEPCDQMSDSRIVFWFLGCVFMVHLVMYVYMCLV